MAPTDDDLLNFDMKRLGGISRAPRRILEEHGDAYRYQLIAARWMQRWAEGVARPSPTDSPDRAYERGYEQALREAIAHLRQGDFLPGGQVYDREIAD